MVFDERCMPLLHQASQLPIADIVHRVMPVFNTTAITVMVDRWRLGTHSFHLLCGKMMVTLKDVAIILRLSIRGCPIPGHVDSASWCERLAMFIGREPPTKVTDVKGREAGVTHVCHCVVSRQYGGYHVLDVHPSPSELERGGFLQLGLSGASVQVPSAV
jgi:hypothetical protein